MQLEKTPHSNEDPQPKINKIIKEKNPEKKRY